MNKYHKIATYFIQKKTNLESAVYIKIVLLNNLIEEFVSYPLLNKRRVADSFNDKKNL